MIDFVAVGEAVPPLSAFVGQFGYKRCTAGKVGLCNSVSENGGPIYYLMIELFLSIGYFIVESPLTL